MSPAARRTASRRTAGSSSSVAQDDGAQTSARSRGAQASRAQDNRAQDNCTQDNCAQDNRTQVTCAQDDRSPRDRPPLDAASSSMRSRRVQTALDALEKRFKTARASVDKRARGRTSGSSRRTCKNARQEPSKGDQVRLDRRDNGSLDDGGARPARPARRRASQPLGSRPLDARPLAGQPPASRAARRREPSAGVRHHGPRADNGCAQPVRDARAAHDGAGGPRLAGTAARAARKR